MKGTCSVSYTHLSAAMTSIPAEIYESAKIDGATPFQKLRYITLPLLKGTINMSAILLLTNAFLSLIHI